MNSAKLEGNNLYIRYECYSSYRGNYMDTKIILVDDIKCITARVGKRGGMHTWDIKSKKDGQSLYSGDRKDCDLIDQIQELLPKIKYTEQVESGGAPW